MNKLTKLKKKLFKRQLGDCRYEEMMEVLAMEAAVAYLAGYMGVNKNDLPAPADAVSGMLQETIDRFREFNATEAGNEKIQLPLPKELHPSQVAALILRYNHVVVLQGRSDDALFPESDYRILFYQTEGHSEGIYTEGMFDAVLRFYPDATIEEIILLMHGINRWLPVLAVTREPYSGRELVAVNNGIFDLKAKKLLPFNPKYIFESKWPVDYVTGPDGPVMHGLNGVGWDIDRWVDNFTRPVNGEPERMCHMPAIWFMGRMGA